MKRIFIRLGGLLVLILTVMAGRALHAQTIQSDSLIIHLRNGERVAIPLASIQKITFDSTSSGVTAGAPDIPNLQLSPSFPNPSSAGTNIGFSIPTSGSVSISIFDSKGNLIRTLSRPNCPAGQNQIIWNGLDDHGNPVPSGSYFYEVRFGNEVQTKQMVVIQ